MTFPCTRYYDFHTRRWLQRDPLWYAGGMSLYGYVGTGDRMLHGICGSRVLAPRDAGEYAHPRAETPKTRAKADLSGEASAKTEDKTEISMVARAP